MGYLQAPQLTLVLVISLVLAAGMQIICVWLCSARN